MKITFLFLLLAGAVIAPATASAAPLVNVDSGGLAIQGYDPVAYFTDNKAVKGSASFKSTYQGATYEFSSAQHKALFDGNPAKYAPQYGGFCTYGVSKGDAAPADPNAFTIIDGKLYLQYSPTVRTLFNQDPAGNLKNASENWPKLQNQAAH